MPQGTFTFIDLFAGVGGFHRALAGAGGDCVFVSDIDRFCREVYAANYDVAGPVAGDITAVDEASIPAHDILAGGFPCQPFSVAGVSKYNALGYEHGFRNETKGTLFFHIARILRHHRPPAFILENVRNLIGHDGGRTFEVIRDTLEKGLDYDIAFEIIDAAHFVPQHRKRIFIVGFRRDLGIDFRFPELPAVDRPALRDLVEEEVDPKYTLSDRLWEYLQEYAAKHRSRGNGFGFGLVDPTDPQVITRTLSARYHKDGSEILIDRGPGRNPRRLTPRECARLMGFPDSHRIPVSDTQAYRQFGNGVVVPVAAFVARAVVDALQQSGVIGTAGSLAA